MRSPAELTAAFRARGLKITPQRQLLFTLLHENPSHPTAESLYTAASERMPGISLRTVYQTLTDLTAMGELQAFDLRAGATRFDPNVDQHQHLVCRSCSKITDVVVDLDRVGVPSLEGFQIESAEIVFHGLCSECAAKSA